MAATLANGGVNPLIHGRVVDAESCNDSLAVIASKAFE
jgi:glutaminase